MFFHRIQKGGKEMKLAYLSFTDKGYSLALRLAKTLGGEVSRCGQTGSGGQGLSLKAWTGESFSQADGLVFVGAAGIAVRAIAPHVACKTDDPAVVVVDEKGEFAVSLLSGHLGGGNDLARRISEVCGAVPVITTATDVNGVFAVDEWAKRQRCRIINPSVIKKVSAALLKGEHINVRCFAHIEGEAPDGVSQIEDGTCHVALDIRHEDIGQEELPLRLVPEIAVLGIGCRKGASCQQIEEGFREMLRETAIAEEAVCAVASIDLKRHEKGIIDFCHAHELPFVTFSPEELKAAEGQFTSSEFVKDITGVDNVCERSAVVASKGALYERKRAGGGVTMAVALKPYRPDWRWKYE